VQFSGSRQAWPLGTKCDPNVSEHQNSSESDLGDKDNKCDPIKSTGKDWMNSSEGKLITWAQ